MTSADFWDSIPREFFNRMFGFNEIQKHKMDFDLMNTKLLMYWTTINNAYIDKKNKPKSFDAFIKSFSGDKKEKKPNEITSKAAFFALVGLKD